MKTLHYVYMMASSRNGTIYTGKTVDLVKRVWDHKKEAVDGFTKKYDIKHLVYYEVHNDHVAALTREKLLKKWHRQWKMRLIEEKNPDWKDLYDDICK